MVTIVPDTYYLDDWEKISAIYKDYTDQHEEQIQALAEWLKKEPHLPPLSKPSLGLFLKMSYDSTEMAKEKIDTYFTLRSKNPEMYTNRVANMKKVEQTLDLFEIGLPELWSKNHRNRRLVFFRIADTDANKLDFHQGMQILTAVLDFEVARVGHKIDGISAIIDFTGFHMGYLPKLNVTDIAAVLKFAVTIENLIAEVHIINCNPLITQVMSLLRPFLTKSLANKIILHTPNQINEFFKIIPKSCVTSTFGGELPSMAEMNETFRKRFGTAEDWIKMVDLEFQVKENLRRVQAGKEEMNGSFRKLCID